MAKKMTDNMTMNMQEVAAKMAKEGRTERRNSRRPRWKEYTLNKYDGKVLISSEKVKINEAEIFPQEEDFFWKPGEKAA